MYRIYHHTDDNIDTCNIDILLLQQMSTDGQLMEEKAANCNKICFKYCKVHYWNFMIDLLLCASLFCAVDWGDQGFLQQMSTKGPFQGRIQDFKLGGAHLKKLRRAEGGTKIFGVFRVKNHDFTKKNHIFFQF